MTENSGVLKRLIVWFLFALIASMAVVVDAGDLPVLHVAKLQDTQTTLDPAAMMDGSLDSAFLAQATQRLLASQDSDHWYRLTLSADWRAAELPVVSFPDARGIYTRLPIWIYAPPDYRPIRLGAGSNAGFSRSVPTVMLPADLRASQGVYIRLGKHLSRAEVIATLDDLSGFLAKDRNDIRLVTAFESVQAAMLLIGLFLWLLLRDRLFLYFFAYIGAQLLYAMLISGEIFQLPGGWAFSALRRVSAPFAMLTTVLAITFVTEFCDLRRSIPRAAALFGAIRWPLLALTPFILFASSEQDWLIFPLLNWLILLACVVAIGCVLVALIKGNRQARYFFVAWLPELGFTIFRVLQLQTGSDLPAWADYGFQASMAFATLVITFGLADQTLRARRERDIADKLANHDQLTGIFNRRAIISRLDEAVAEAHRNERPLALLFVDVDHFKLINDSHGHAVGDRCLQGIVKAASRELRSGDWIGRYGGEEFVVVLPDANAESARAIGERVRAGIESHPILVDGETVRMTVSVGVAGITDGRDNTDTLLERADAALYRAKSDGRNRVSIDQNLVAVSA